jgi:hypothetical protein
MCREFREHRRRPHSGLWWLAEYGSTWIEAAVLYSFAGFKRRTGRLTGPA